MGQLIGQAACGARQPCGRPILSGHADLHELALADECEFIDRYYAPERAVLVVAGNVDRTAGEAAIAPAFASVLPRGTPRRQHVAAIEIGAGTSRHEPPVRRASADIVAAAPVFADREGAYDETLRRLFGLAIASELIDLDCVTSFEVGRLGGP